MTRATPRSVVFAISLVVAASIACGDSSGTLSPSGIAGSSRSGAVITGHVNGVSSLPAASAAIGPRSTTSLRVTISGTDISTAVDGAGNFTLNGAPPGTVTLQFSGSGVNATVTLSGVTAGETIRVEITLTNNGARVDSDSRRRDSDREIEGTISAINAGARTIQVGSTTVTIPDTAKIRRGGTTLTFADLRLGQEVEVHAVVDGTTFRATEVEIEDNDDDRDALTELTGAVSSLTGTCPSITFVVRERTVRTGPATSFDGGCSRVRNGVRVEAKGALAGDGSLMASRVEIDD